MTARLSIKHVTVDCAQPRLLARWWATLLDWDIEHDSSDYVVISDRSQTDAALGFIHVDETESGKNRWHLDLAVTGTWTDAASRARGLGAVELARHSEYEHRNGSFSPTLRATSSASELHATESTGLAQ